MEDLLQEGDVFSLNIVATPAAPKQSVAKKKPKNNKYERRRARAARARGETNRESRGTTIETPATGKQKKAVEYEENDKEPELIESEPDDDESAVDLQRDHASVPQEKAVQKRDSLQDPEERAKYMAEFHARPLELDRRFGATTKPAITSKDSSHLFATSAEWPANLLHPRLLNTLKTSGWTRPTTIQARAMPSFFSNDDNVMIHSETGSGKTLAFFIPILSHLAAKDQKVRCEGTRCVILCPTRELAVQTFDLVETLSSKTFNWIVCGQLLGEEKRKSEKARIRKGLSVIVATPGRFLDHLSRTECLLPALTSKGPLEWLVLDEADRLLDMGLGEQVKSIFDRIQQEAKSKTWRCVLVSATVTASVEELALKTLSGKSENWVRIRANEVDKATLISTGKDESAGEEALVSSTPRQLAHHHVTVTAKLRLAALMAFLVPRRKERTVVFMSTCASVDFHHALLTKMKSLFGDESSGIFGSDCNILKLHGNVPHSERQHVLKRFLKENQGAILLATDVAARGLNLPNVDWTVQYDPPSEVSDYVHRAGRVARAGKAGNSLIFLLPSEKLFLEVLKRQGIKNMNALSLTETLNVAAKCCPELTSSGMRRSSGGLGNTGKGSSSSRLGEAFCWEMQHRLEECVNEDQNLPKKSSYSVTKKRMKAQEDEKTLETLLDIAQNAFISHLRAYPTREKVVRQIFAAKSLHLGHVARSFGLKEPPSRISNKKRKVSPPVDPRKNNATFDFKASQVLSESSKSSKGKATPKSLLLENASRLEKNGMDAL
ncbi:ATP-dependent RNA helicase DDX31/DBP7 [Fistulifera solaris]|uniref:ATP-dependent RNA helicase n=1 Tax=Fistulifera solaris TaxID=1519565 RepID=A0A1Z5J5M0_FISSO|nr:ATP-dependent RNA helicase DDX31/DBP7 [Fistulifera solaris]|eukprot:GAX09236.1 ATP-dependent RNA helicase DDX31/DBP7 [Fistulifera solaris]